MNWSFLDYLMTFSASLQVTTWIVISLSLIFLKGDDTGFEFLLTALLTRFYWLGLRFFFGPVIIVWEYLLSWIISIDFNILIEIQFLYDNLMLIYYLSDQILNLSMSVKKKKYLLEGPIKHLTSHNILAKVS